jgi:hypothetical protein
MNGEKLKLPKLPFSDAYPALPRWSLDDAKLVTNMRRRGQGDKCRDQSGVQTPEKASRPAYFW